MERRKRQLNFLLFLNTRDSSHNNQLNHVSYIWHDLLLNGESPRVYFTQI